MATLRKIVVDGRTWLWCYRYYYSDERDSYIRIISDDKQGQVVIYFRVGAYNYGGCPFNDGLAAFYRGEKITINMNQPRFIAQLLAHVLKDIPGRTLSGVMEYQNGIGMLHQLGYEFEYK
ncbi:hypothetical protein ABJ851_003290 [Shigella flexneri]|nr:hypothetical protein [Escherichia coli]